MAKFHFVDRGKTSPAKLKKFYLRRMIFFSTADESKDLMPLWGGGREMKTAKSQKELPYEAYDIQYP